MNKLFLFILFLGPFFIVSSFTFSQDYQKDLDKINEQDNKFFIAHIKIYANNVFLNAQNYIEMSLNPFFKIQNFIFAFTFPVRLNIEDHGFINQWDYIYPGNYFKFVHNISYITPNKTFQAHISTLTNISMGEGLLISGFRNDLFLPTIPQLGLTINGNWKYGGFQLFTSDITQFSLTGVEIYTKPFASSKNSLINNSKLYGIFLYDIDTQAILLKDNNTMNWSYNKNSSQRFAYSIGITTPLLIKDQLTLSTSLEYAAINNKQYAALNSLLLTYKNYSLNIGLAYLYKGFHMNFFSSLYTTPDIREDRGETSTKTHNMGYKITNTLSLFDNNMNLYIHIYGQTDPLISIQATLELKPYIFGRLSLLLTYITEDIAGLNDILWNGSRDFNKFIVTKIAYDITDNAQLGFFYRHNLRTDSKNTNIKTNNEVSLNVALFF